MHQDETGPRAGRTGPWSKLKWGLIVVFCLGLLILSYGAMLWALIGLMHAVRTLWAGS